jgi:hypothetical protein
MASGERVKCFARNEFLGDLSFEFDAMGTVPGHGFHPLKARQSWSIHPLRGGIGAHRPGFELGSKNIGQKFCYGMDPSQRKEVR